ncbi:MAG: sulfite exporter TauE/SafE family protein [Nitrososphaerales archaeon]
MVDIFALLSIGVLGYLIGFVGGIVGLVLGVLRLPIIYIFALNPAMAAGTNIGISTLGSFSSFIRHAKEKRVDYQVFVIMSFSSALGAFIGGYLSWIIPAWILLFVIALILLWQGIDFAKTKKPKGGNSEALSLKREKIGSSRILEELFLGFLIGLLGGMVGLVLGTLRIPAMVKMLNMEPKIAVGTNTSVAFVMGFFGFLGHITFGQINWLILLVMGGAAMVGGFMGAKYTGIIASWKLKKLLGFILLIVSGVFFFEIYSWFQV